MYNFVFLPVLSVEMAPKTKGGKGKRCKKDLRPEPEMPANSFLYSSTMSKHTSGTRNDMMLCDTLTLNARLRQELPVARSLSVIASLRQAGEPGRLGDPGDQSAYHAPEHRSLDSEEGFEVPARLLHQLLNQCVVVP